MTVRAEDVRTTHGEKVFYPDTGATKGDVVEHYRSVAEVMVAHLRGRPLTLRRFPDGIEAEGWFQKEASEHFPDWMRIEAVPQRGERASEVHHVVCDDAATLVYLANQGTVEFHTWLATMDSLDHPDLLVVDIDPPEGTDLADIRQTGARLRELYQQVGLTPFVQATGGRGFHVVAPLDGGTGFDAVRELSRDLAEHLVEQAPERLTTAQRKDKRGGRIFLDTNRNAYGQTFVAPYSLRARPGAPVATPVDTREANTARPDGWDIQTIRRRMAQKADPWQDLSRYAASAQQAHQRFREL